MHYSLIETLFVEEERDLVNRRDVTTFDHSAEFDVAKESNLSLHFFRKRPLGTTDQDIWLDSDLHQLPHRVLCRLGLHFARGGNERHQRQVNEDGVFAADLVAELSDRFQKWERLDVANRAANFDDHDVTLGGESLHRALDLVGDVGNHLYGRSQVLAASLLGDDA